MTALDREIDAAVASLDGPAASAKPFDPQQYIAAFEASAQEKARDVLQCLKQDEYFSAKKPFLVSIGGGDGAEIDYLLQNSPATDGVLIELVEPIAQMARLRVLPAGKSLDVVVKPAQTGIVEAMAKAIRAVSRWPFLSLKHELLPGGFHQIHPSK
jgi:hypothetical protein